MENGCVESLKVPGNEAKTRSRVRVRVSIDWALDVASMLDVAIERQEGKKLPGLRVGWAIAHPAHPADTALIDTVHKPLCVGIVATRNWTRAKRQCIRTHESADRRMWTQ